MGLCHFGEILMASISHHIMQHWFDKQTVEKFQLFSIQLKCKIKIMNSAHVGIEE